MKVASQVMSILHRAQEIARREESNELRLRHILHAYLFRPITPALEQHLLRAAAIAEDANSSAVSDLHLLQSILEDADNSVTQILRRHTDLPSLLSEVHRSTEFFDQTDHE